MRAKRVNGRLDVALASYRKRGVVEQASDDLFQNTGLHRDRREGPAVRMRRPWNAPRVGQMSVEGFRRGEHPSGTEVPNRRQYLVMDLQDRQIKAPTILGHWQVNAILVNVFPFKRKGL